jgi:Na+-transporting NADH:ubiquinone oxidoreductase subunit NqrB
MRWVRAQLDQIAPHFEHGGKLAKWHPLWEAVDTFFYSPASVTKTAAHVRDAIDLKRIMMTVVIAALPCVLMAMFNTGLQANLAIDPAKAAALEGWRHDAIRWLGTGYSPRSAVANFVHGALYFLPLYVVTMVVGLTWEVMFAIVRKVEVNEGFFVTGILFPLILPPTMIRHEPTLLTAMITAPIRQASADVSPIDPGSNPSNARNHEKPAVSNGCVITRSWPSTVAPEKPSTAAPAGTAVHTLSPEISAG